jgi:Mn-dependent DtxR family transcriptional regulator
MLTKLLRRVAQGGAHSTAVLARELGVSEGLLAQMTATLVQIGYLKPVSGGCVGQCGGCSLAGSCSIGGLGGVWTLTEKGERVAEAR